MIHMMTMMKMRMMITLVAMMMIMIVLLINHVGDNGNANDNGYYNGDGNIVNGDIGSFGFYDYGT